MSGSMCLDSIPNAKMNEIIRVLEALDVLGCKSDRSGIAFAMGIKEKSTSHPILGCIALGLVEEEENELKVTDFGTKFIASDDEQRQDIVGKFLSDREPFVTLLRALKRNPLTKDDIAKYVKAKMSSARKWGKSTETKRIEVIRNWCEFGNLMVYDSDTNTYSLVL